MSYNVTANGVVYTLPSQGEEGWSAEVDAFFVALGSGLFRSGGSQVLAAQLLLGAFGITAGNFTSNTANQATTGVVNLANTDRLVWKDVTNSFDVGLLPGPQNQLQWLQNGLGADLNGHPHAIYQSTVGQSIPSNTSTIINFNTQELDTNSAVTTGASWKFTVPTGKGGVYSVAFTATYATAPATGQSTVLLWKNGVGTRTLWSLASGVPAAGTVAAGQTLIKLNATDFIDLRMQNTGTGAAVLSNSSSASAICITRLQD